MILNIKKSSILAAIVSGTHFGALLLAIVLPIAPAFKIGLAALICASFRRHGRYGMRATVCTIQLEDDGSCNRTANGEQSRYRIARATAHTGFVRLMLVREGEQTRTQLVLRDAVEPEVYRDLRARIVQRRLSPPDASPV